MDLIDRYLHAVKSFLPRTQQDDIIRELAEDLRSQAEDREAELGRPLTQPEQEAMLRQWGHPLLLASRYRPQRHLIGPCIFPIYWRVLLMSLGVALLVHLVANAVMVASGTPVNEAINRIVTLPVGPLLSVFAWVTLVFAVFDMNLDRFPFVATWNPNSLPMPRSEDGAAPTFALLTEIVCLTLMVVWWGFVPRYQWLLFGPASALVELAPVWRIVHLPILFVYLASLATLWVRLLQPGRKTLRLTLRIIVSLAHLPIAWYLLASGPLVVGRISAGGQPPEGVIGLANTIAMICVAAVLIVSVIEALRDSYRLFTAPSFSDARRFDTRGS
jgi:hypothetical protein